MRDKSLVEILGSVVHEVHQALEVERTLIFARRGAEELEVRAGIGCAYASAGHLGEDACGLLARKAFAHRRTEVQNFKGILDLGLTRPFCIERQVVAVPIASPERVHGVIECFNRLDGKDFEGHQIELLERVAGRMALAIENAELLDQIRQSGINAVIGLATALDAKDAYTASHSHNVGEYGFRIAAALGLPYDACERIKLAGILHDLGKIGIPDDVLNKPDKLTDAEFELIKSHPVGTGKILAHFGDLQDVRASAATHHERWDGFGYPDRLKGEQIPIGGRIICLADAFDTLTSDRKYRARVTMEFALQEMSRNRGRQFDPACVDALFRALVDLGEVDLNGNRLPLPEELERLRTEPPPLLKPPPKPKPAEPEPTPTRHESFDANPL
jgi:HD-GYP domain-containing protein (c-di-GMP phosphodiesterase class II)